MDQSFFSELLTTLRSVGATAMAFAVIAFFATAALLLWMWRGSVLEARSRDEDRTDGP